MRTTLDIESDVLQAAKELAHYEKSTTGKVVSRLLRQALTSSCDKSQSDFIYKNGIPILASRGEIVTLEHVQAIMDEEGI